MNNLFETLVRVIRCALTSNLYQDIDDFDPSSFVHLAYHQEVAALAYDAVNKLYQSGNDIINDKEAKLRLLKQALKQEQQYTHNVKTITKLSEFFEANNIVMYVLKGLSTAQNYSKPFLRYSCDMDCLLADKCADGYVSRFEEGNLLIENKRISVSRDYYKHSEFKINGLYVENHKFCCSIKRGKRTRELEQYLQSLLGQKPEKDTLYGLYFPPLMFQAVFMIEHANSHFLYEKINLKHVCDWAMFREANKERLDWDEFRHQCNRFGLSNFVDAMDSLADLMLGIKEYDELSILEKRIFDDLMQVMPYIESKMKRRFRKAFGVLQSSWKFKYFGHSSMLKELITSFFAFLFEKDPKLMN